MDASDASASADVEAKIRTSPLRVLVLCPSTPPSTSVTPPPQAPATPLENPPLSRLLVPPFLEALTSVAPSSDTQSYSGYTSHPPLQLRTQYYNADVGIWVDEIPYAQSSSTSRNEDQSSHGSVTDDEIPSLSSYKSLLLSPEAREVRDVIGAVVVTIPLPESSVAVQGSKADLAQEGTRSELQNYAEFLHAITEIRDEVESERGSDVAGLIVLTATTRSTHTTDKMEQEGLDAVVGTWEEGLLEQGILGWDVVAWQAPAGPEPKEDRDDAATNEYGEKLGIPRVIEILEAVDWFAGRNASLGPHDDASGDEGEIEFANGPEDEIEMRKEMMGLSMAIRYPELDQSDDEQDSDYESGIVPPEGIIMQQRPSKQAREGLLSGSAKAEREAFPGGGPSFLDNVDVDADNDEEFKIESLPGLMDRVLAIKEQAAGMQKEEKERFAKKEIEKIMGEI